MIENTDGYKLGHVFQYPKNTSMVYSNFTPRSTRLLEQHMAEDWDKKITVCGLQVFLIKILIEGFHEGFFSKPMDTVIGEYKDLVDHYLGKDAITTDHIVALWKLGYLPLCIKALPEGTRVKAGVPYVTIVNTLPQFGWVTNYIETIMSCETWHPVTVATVASAFKKVCFQAAEETGSPMEFVEWQLHDFSMRGMPDLESAKNAGMAHLMHSYGTDTIPAIKAMEKYYFANRKIDLIGGSIPATEHSVMCAGGKEDESETVRRIIQDVYPSGNSAIVADTWNLWKVIAGPDSIAAKLKDIILNRIPNALGMAKVVFRPDSGNPVDIICGTAVAVEKLEWNPEIADAFKRAVSVTKGPIPPVVVLHEGKYYEVLLDIQAPSFKEIVPTPEMKGAVECLWDIFGGTHTQEGYKVLHERVGLIYGDSITVARAKAIFARLKAKGFASCNIVFGVGSYAYLGMLSRDSLGIACKSTACIVEGEFRELQKDPITDDGTKKSAKGLLKVVRDEDGELKLLDQQPFTDMADLLVDHDDDELKIVFINGRMPNIQLMPEIRERIATELRK